MIWNQSVTVAPGVVPGAHTGVPISPWEQVHGGGVLFLSPFHSRETEAPSARSLSGGTADRQSGHGATTRPTLHIGQLDKWCLLPAPKELALLREVHTYAEARRKGCEMLNKRPPWKLRRV